MTMKHKLLDYLDILHSEGGSAALHKLESEIAKIIDKNGLSSYFAHNISFCTNGEISIGVYGCGLKQGEIYVNKADHIIISTKPKIKTLVTSKDSHIKLTTELRTLIEQWGTLV